MKWWNFYGHLAYHKVLYTNLRKTSPTLWTLTRIAAFRSYKSLISVVVGIHGSADRMIYKCTFSWILKLVLNFKTLIRDYFWNSSYSHVWFDGASYMLLPKHLGYTRRKLKLKHGCYIFKCISIFHNIIKLYSAMSFTDSLQQSNVNVQERGVKYF